MNDERRGEGVWLLIFLALLLGAKPATDAAGRLRASSDAYARQLSPSAASRAEIPPDYLRAYRAAARGCPGLSWAVLAGIGKVESDHGRSPLPGVRSGANWAGAAGPMQFGIGGKAGPTWQHYGTGRLADVYRIGPAARAAARMLCADGAPADLDGALHSYNCGRPRCPAADGYAARVLSLARRYQQGR
jgi:hypothetical protein